MLRLIGAVLVIGATGAMGLSGVRRLRARVAAIGSLVVSLELMESEICSRLAPMRQVLEQLSDEAPDPARKLFRNAAAGMERLGKFAFSQIWREAVKSTRELGLRQDEAETLSELGLCLGRYDVKEQSESILRVKRRMESFLKRAEAERDRDSKLHAFFGIASGVFAVIILL